MFLRDRERLSWFAAARHKGGGGGGQQTTQTVQKSDPWSGQQPYLTFGFEQAKDQYNSTNPSFFPGQTYVNQSPETLAAMNMTTDRAMYGSNALRAADQGVADTASGKFLGQGNPYYDQLVGTATRSIAPGLESRYAAGGRFGSAGMKEAVSRGISDAVVPQLFQDYGNERQRMLQASAMAPGIAQAGYMDANALANVGRQREAFSQQGLDENIARHNYEQNLQANKLAQFMNLIQGQYGGESLSTSTGPKMGGNTGFLDFMGPMMSGLGGLGSGLGALGWLPFSDRRLKRDIRHVGETYGNLPVYLFRYLDSDEDHIGVMADEVLEVIPEAAHMHPSGYWTVDYSRIV